MSSVLVHDSEFNCCLFPALNNFKLLFKNGEFVLLPIFIVINLSQSHSLLYWGVNASRHTSWNFFKG